MGKKMMSKDNKPRMEKGWAIIDPTGFIHTVSACDSPKFIWRKFMMLKAYDETEMQYYKKNGYRCIRVLITPL